MIAVIYDMLSVFRKSNVFAGSDFYEISNGSLVGRTVGKSEYNVFICPVNCICTDAHDNFRCNIILFYVQNRIVTAGCACQCNGTELEVHVSVYTYAVQCFTEFLIKYKGILIPGGRRGNDIYPL